MEIYFIIDTTHSHIAHSICGVWRNVCVCVSVYVLFTIIWVLLHLQIDCALKQLKCTREPSVVAVARYAFMHKAPDQRWFSQFSGLHRLQQTLNTTAKWLHTQNASQLDKWLVFICIVAVGFARVTKKNTHIWCTFSVRSFAHVR